VLAGKALADSFYNCGQRFKVIGDLADGAEMMGDAFRHAAQMITHVEDLRASSNAALDRTLQDHFRSYLQGELVAAKNQKRLYDKTEQQYKSAESKLQKAKTGRIDHARVFELEKEFNAIQATFDQVRKDTTQTLNDTNDQHCQQTLERLADTIHIYHDMFRKGLSTIEEFLPIAAKMREFTQNRRRQSNTPSAASLSAPGSSSASSASSSASSASVASTSASPASAADSASSSGAGVGASSAHGGPSESASEVRVLDGVWLCCMLCCCVVLRESESERECVCVLCVRVRVRVELRERERESVCVCVCVVHIPFLSGSL
jgi:BAR domain of APPL family